MIGRLRERFQSHLRISTNTTVTTPASSEPEAALCATCAAINFKEILRDGLPESKMLFLGTLLDINDRKDRCAFCRLVADLIRRRWRLDDLPGVDVQGTRCFVSARGLDNPPDLDKRKEAYNLYIIASRPPDVLSALFAAKGAFYLDIRLLEEDAYKVARSRVLLGRRLPDRVDIHLIKKWLKLCERTHGGVCGTVWWNSGGEDLPEFVRMVDVSKMALVCAGRGRRYVALSYVWGGSGEDYWTSTANVEARYCRFGLVESALPATIVDAIQVTRQLGERYLWVDALCIIQDSQEDKVAQIAIMDRVYGRATLTIFAADGTSVRDRLSGVKTGSRVLSQRVECVQGLHLSIPLPSVMEAVTDSTWDTRGWTFQETVLSRRRLYFTKQQVYFECSVDVWCEDLFAESITLQGSFQPMRYWNTGFLPFSPVGTVAMNYRAYETAVDRYTRRRLTVESDIIYAITALTNAMTRALEPVGSNSKDAFRLGMWIRNLDLSLLWQPRLDVVHTRRTITNAEHSYWPSWAWSGWKGAVYYQVESHFLDGSDQDVLQIPTESLVTAWNVVDGDGTIVRLDVNRIPPSWGVDEDSDGHPLEKYVPTKSHLSDLDLEFVPLSGTLVFRTQCAHFRVSKVDDGMLLDPSIAKAHAIFHITPINHNPLHYAGRVILPVSTPLFTILEFVVLSRSDGVIGLYDESVWGKRYSGFMLHVMAVQRMHDDARVSERVGIGLVVESAWMKSGAEERVVLLA